MFTINEFFNVSVSSISFEKNAVVLILQSVSSNGNVKIRVLQFANCPDTKPQTIVKHLLKGFLSEFTVANEFNEHYKSFDTGATVNGIKEQVKTGIQAKRKFLQFLKTPVIFKTDSNGKLAQAIKCDDGLMLSDTALNIKTEQVITLFGYNSSQFRSALHHTANAILEQCSFYSTVENEYRNIENGLLELANLEQEQAQAQAKKVQEQAKENKKKTA